jgi:dihydrofolate synthase/folylpolyglutamate synthase
MTHEQALDFWFGRVNYEQRSPQPSDLTLDRIRGLLELLGNPHERLRIAHVAGSKGKGSTSAMLASILHRAGYRTGLFTSPHLVRVEERFQVNGQPISAEELTALLTKVRDACAEEKIVAEPGTPSAEAVPLDRALTFFEIATAVCFLHFVQRRVDVAILEVGLGGRFDSTNVCQPLVSVITSISYDHTQQLGSTLAKIAREKAGIIKEHRPTVSGARAPEARVVIETICKERRSRLRQIDREVFYRHEPGQVGASQDRLPRVEVTTARRRWPWLEVGLLGEHQAANAAVALATVEELQELGFTIPDAAVQTGLAQVRWPARLEVLSHQPLVVLDCAHNLASAEAMLDTLKTSVDRRPTDTEGGRRFLIFGGSRDKDLVGMLRLLTPYFHHTLLTRFASPRSVPPEELVALVPPGKGSFVACSSPQEAWAQARTAAGPDDLICVTGSVFLAGEMRPLMVRGLEKSEPEPPLCPS